MSKAIARVVGLDIGDRSISVCAVDPRTGKVIGRETVRAERDGVEAWLVRLGGRSRVVMETGTKSPWIARLVREHGHEVLVADARRVKLITDSSRKTDRRDAEMLARLGAAELGLLRPVYVRSESIQRQRALLRMRDAAVRARSMLINALRGIMKTDGVALPTCSAEAFPRKAWNALPEHWRPGVMPLLRAILQQTRTIRAYDRELERVLFQEHAEVAQRLGQVAGVGPLTSLAVVTAVEDPLRFRNGRQMAAYLGLVPRIAQSGQSDPSLGITKEGDAYARRLLVTAAHYILERGPDTDLKRWGLGLEARWGPRTRKRAAVAVARKLATLLWRLWVSGDRYVLLKEAA